VRYQWWRRIDLLNCRAFGHDWVGRRFPDDAPDDRFEVCLRCGVIEENDRDLTSTLTG
jgi:hypothetical protein